MREVGAPASARVRHPAIRRIEQRDHASRLEIVLNEPVTINDPAAPVAIGRLQGAIAFDEVSFSYKPGDPVLRDINVTIPAGTVCALVGPSGAGKSTFANLVPRFYEASRGRDARRRRTQQSAACWCGRYHPSR